MLWKFERVPHAVARLRRTIKRADNRWTVRVKYNKVCVMRTPTHRDMKTEAQLECRERFRVVNDKVAKEFNDPARRVYWEKRACKEGYKTARGCARAFYMAETRREEQHTTETTSSAATYNTQATAQSRTTERYGTTAYRATLPLSDIISMPTQQTSERGHSAVLLSDKQSSAPCITGLHVGHAPPFFKRDDGGVTLKTLGGLQWLTGD